MLFTSSLARVCRVIFGVKTEPMDNVVPGSKLRKVFIVACMEAGIPVHTPGMSPTLTLIRVTLNKWGGSRKRFLEVDIVCSWHFANTLQLRLTMNPSMKKLITCSLTWLQRPRKASLSLMMGGSLFWREKILSLHVM